MLSSKTPLNRESLMLEKIREIVLRFLPAELGTVYLFGSHATGRTHRTSDVDLGVDPREALPPGLLPRLREALEESTIPCQVEIVDLRETDHAFRDRIRREGVVWNG